MEREQLRNELLQLADDSGQLENLILAQASAWVMALREREALRAELENATERATYEAMEERNAEAALLPLLPAPGGTGKAKTSTKEERQEAFEQHLRKLLESNVAHPYTLAQKEVMRLQSLLSEAETRFQEAQTRAAAMRTVADLRGKRLAALTALL